MYCKHCGKPIADDSKFCQHCGGLLEYTTIDKNQKKDNILLYIKKLSDKTKLYIICFVLWFVVHFSLLFSFSDYGAAEFTIFSIGLPLLVVCFCLIIKGYKKVLSAEPKETVDTFRKRRIDALSGVGIWSAFCLVISILDYWEDDTYDDELLLWCIIIGSTILLFGFLWKETLFIIKKIYYHFTK